LKVTVPVTNPRGGTFALEQLWQRNDDWPAIGDAAAAHVRAIYPTDPCGTFADHLEAVRHVVQEAS